jgi:hypothetical protein
VDQSVQREGVTCVNGTNTTVGTSGFNTITLPLAHFKWVSCRSDVSCEVRCDVSNGPHIHQNYDKFRTMKGTSKWWVRNSWNCVKFFDNMVDIPESKMKIKS